MSQNDIKLDFDFLGHIVWLLCRQKDIFNLLPVDHKVLIIGSYLLARCVSSQSDSLVYSPLWSLDFFFARIKGLHLDTTQRVLLKRFMLPLFVYCFASVATAEPINAQVASVSSCEMQQPLFWVLNANKHSALSKLCRGVSYVEINLFVTQMQQVFRECTVLFIVCQYWKENTLKILS